MYTDVFFVGPKHSLLTAYGCLIACLYTPSGFASFLASKCLAIQHLAFPVHFVYMYLHRHIHVYFYTFIHNIGHPQANFPGGGRGMCSYIICILCG